MIEQNYLEYSTAIKETMGLKVDWKEKINNEAPDNEENNEPSINKEEYTDDINEQVNEDNTKSNE